MQRMDYPDRPVGTAEEQIEQLWVTLFAVIEKYNLLVDELERKELTK